jgi:transcriptional regulator with XRE-family HTH domain
MTVESRGDNSVSLGERILERRKALEITQQELTVSLGVTPQHISLLEQNKVAPSLPLLAGLAKELGVSVDYLVSGKEGIITETIPAIKADRRLKVKAKKALVALVEEIYAGESTGTQSSIGKNDDVASK